MWYYFVELYKICGIILVVIFKCVFCEDILQEGLFGVLQLVVCYICFCGYVDLGDKSIGYEVFM